MKGYFRSPTLLTGASELSRTFPRLISKLFDKRGTAI
jgi:hypothetical protein